MGLDVVREVVLRFGNGVDLFRVHEILVEALDFEGGAGLVDGGLGEGDEDGEEEADEGEEEDCAFAAAEDVPVFEEAAGGGVLDELAGVAGGASVYPTGLADAGAGRSC